MVMHVSACQRIDRFTFLGVPGGGGGVVPFISPMFVPIGIQDNQCPRQPVLGTGTVLRFLNQFLEAVLRTYKRLFPHRVFNYLECTGSGVPPR